MSSESKSLSTLVEDIYDLFKSDVVASRDSVLAFSNSLADRLGERLSEVRGKPELRMSNLGDPCRRRLWYRINTPELGAPLAPHVRVMFLIGDIVEEVLFWLSELAGHKVTRRQEELDINGVKGHIDGFIDDTLVDAKSASSKNFQKFAQHRLIDDDPYGYIGQIGSYTEATNEKEAAFVAVDIHPRQDVDYGKQISEIREQLASPNPPERGFSDVPDGESGNRRLVSPCSTCDFKNVCWPGLRTIPYANGTRYLTTVVREPTLRGRRS